MIGVEVSPRTILRWIDKYTADVRSLLELGKAVAGEKPKTFTTDGTANFVLAPVTKATRSLKERTGIEHDHDDFEERSHI